MKKSRLYLVLGILLTVIATLHLLLVVGKAFNYPFCGWVHWMVFAIALDLFTKSKYYKHLAYSQILLLGNLSASDSDASQEEMNLLAKYMIKLGCTKKKWDKIIAKYTDDNGGLKVLIPEKEKEKKAILTSLHDMMITDGKIKPAEKEFIQNVAKMYGVDATPYITK